MRIRSDAGGRARQRGDSGTPIVSPGILHLVVMVGRESRTPLPRAPRPPRSWTRYGEGESFWISGAELERLKPAASDFVADVLHSLDFKWLDGTARSGFGTRVHFGYSSAKLI